ncbi:MAG: pentapeptide repeat-containing protein, partial [Chloroflexi bacterium]|nr:pentapeptide repeat-containing protein [Chloroflexota bacterium]
LDRLEDQFRRTLSQIIAGVVILLGVYVAWRRASAVEKTVEVSREGQITERFTKAIELLGSDNTAICLGGIYALERIAKDSPKNDHRQVMEVLTAYVRENAGWDEARAAEEDPNKEHRPLITIQAILTVLGRRDRGHEDEDFHLDLSDTDLRGADLRQTHLEGARLNEAHLQRANLNEAHLEGAELFGAYLKGAVLFGAHLEEASLKDAHLQGADFADAHLEGASLKDARLEGTDLRGASGLTKEQIESALTDEKTRLPDYLREEDETQEQ